MTAFPPGPGPSPQLLPGAPGPSPFLAALARHAAVAELAPAELEILARHLEWQRRPAGEAVVREGDGDRVAYLVLGGRALVSRRGVLVAWLGPGDQFGELALVAGRPRSATVVSDTELGLASLDLPCYRALAAGWPALALKLVEALLGGLGLRLTDMTESVGQLLRERSLRRRARVEVCVDGVTVSVATGTPLGELLPAERDGSPIVAAALDRRAVSLVRPVSSTCHVVPITAAGDDGARVVRRSAALVLLEAAHRLDPALGLSMGHSVGFGQRVLVEGVDVAGARALRPALEARVAGLLAENPPLREEWWTIDEARELAAERGWRDMATLLDCWGDDAVLLCSYGEVYVLGLGPFLPAAGRAGPLHLGGDDGGLLLHYPRRAPPEPGAARRAEPSDGPEEVRRVAGHTAAALRHDRWLRTLDIGSVGAFNRACVTGSVPQLIRVAEGFHEKRVTEIADEISGLGGARVVCVAGPSSSGKTTFIKRLKVQLQVDGMRPLELSLDDYYVDRERTPRGPDQEYDFEALEALQLDRLRTDLARVLAGERVRTPRYDFETGQSQPEGGPELALGPHEVLLVEGIHGLNPALLPGLSGGPLYRIFVCPLTQLPFDRLSRVHPSDVRLLRRVVRDRRARNHDASATLTRWSSVRAGERRHIFPYQHLADAVFDSSLVYEPSVLKAYAVRYLLEVPRTHRAYTSAAGLIRLLEPFVPIHPDHVPPTSLLREFIGGGGFEY